MLVGGQRFLWKSMLHGKVSNGGPWGQAFGGPWGQALGPWGQALGQALIN